jgi:hypothetical protein
MIDYIFGFATLILTFIFGGLKYSLLHGSVSDPERAGQAILEFLVPSLIVCSIICLYSGFLKKNTTVKSLKMQKLFVFSAGALGIIASLFVYFS